MASVFTFCTVKSTGMLTARQGKLAGEIRNSQEYSIIVAIAHPLMVHTGQSVCQVTA